MTAYIIVKYIHFLSIFGMFSSLVAELVLAKKSFKRHEIRRLFIIDGLYGGLSVLVVAAGLILWFGVGKPASHYDNLLFYIKITIALLVGLISLFPTIFLFTNRQGDINDEIKAPKYFKKLIILELSLLALIPPLASMAAYGMHWR